MTSQLPRSNVTLATRGSALALWQADYVTSALTKAGLTVKRLVLKTQGDRVQDRFLHEIGGKGLFIKELEEALLSGEADLAVHSLKDMPARLPAKFTLAAVLKRHSPCDAIIFRDDIAARLKPTAVLTAAQMRAFGPLTVATGSLRRQSILAGVAPEATTVGVRGNVDTRLNKLKGGAWDSLILAEASLDRLGFKDIARCQLRPDWFIPSPSQGALAVETRADDDLAPWLNDLLGDAETTMAVEIERQLLSRLGGDCTMPFGGHAAPLGTKLHVQVAVYGRSGEKVETICEVPYQGPHSVKVDSVVQTLVQQLKAAGVAKILRGLELAVPAEFT